MSPELIAALLAITLVVVLIALVHVVRLGRTVDRFDGIVERALAAEGEQARLVAALESVQEAQRAAEQVIDTGASIVREVHRGIANIPFDILETIPGTAKPTKAVRDIHDAITEGVYSALSGLNKAVGREVRRSLEAKMKMQEAKIGQPVLPDEEKIKPQGKPTS